MSKLKVKQQLVETTLKTDELGVHLKITPFCNDRVDIQFGHSDPTTQVASAADLRELADIFTEIAELLKGDSKPREGAAKPEKGTRAVRVELVTDANSPTLHGVFSELTDKQVEALEHAIRVMNAALPWEQRIYVTY